MGQVRMDSWYLLALGKDAGGCHLRTSSSTATEAHLRLVWADAAQRSRVSLPEARHRCPVYACNRSTLLKNPDRMWTPLAGPARGARGLDRLNLQSVHWLFTTEAEAAACIRGIPTPTELPVSLEKQDTSRLRTSWPGLHKRREVRRERREPRPRTSWWPWNRERTCRQKTGTAASVLPEYDRGPLGHSVSQPMLVRGARGATRASECRGDGTSGGPGGCARVSEGASPYGRYWGCPESHDALHFEVCYYQLVEYAIENGLALVEAGAQGHHVCAI